MNWTGPPAGRTSMAEVREVTVLRRGKGFWQGLGIGALVGFGTGLGIGLVWNTTCTTEPPLLP